MGEECFRFRNSRYDGFEVVECWGIICISKIFIIIYYRYNVYLYYIIIYKVYSYRDFIFRRIYIRMFFVVMFR